MQTAITTTPALEEIKTALSKGEINIFELMKVFEAFPSIQKIKIAPLEKLQSICIKQIDPEIFVRNARWIDINELETYPQQNTCLPPNGTPSTVSEDEKKEIIDLLKGIIEEIF